MRQKEILERSDEEFILTGEAGEFSQADREAQVSFNLFPPTEKQV